MRIYLSSDISAKTVGLSAFRFITNLTDQWLLDKIEAEGKREAKINVQSGVIGKDFGTEVDTSAEYKLIGSPSDSLIYMVNTIIPGRMLQDETDEVIYKFNIRGEGSDEFYELLGIEKPDDVTKLRLEVYVLNGFKLSVSTDKADYRTVIDCNDPYAANADNAGFYPVVFNSQELQFDVLYLKFSVSDVFDPSTTHAPMLSELQFYFN